MSWGSVSGYEDGCEEVVLGGFGFVLGWWLVWLFGMGWECDVGHASSGVET